MNSALTLGTICAFKTIHKIECGTVDTSAPPVNTLLEATSSVSQLWKMWQWILTTWQQVFALRITMNKYCCQKAVVSMLVNGRIC